MNTDAESLQNIKEVQLSNIQNELYTMIKVIYSKDIGHFHTQVSTNVIHIFKKHVNVSIDAEKALDNIQTTTHD